MERLHCEIRAMTTDDRGDLLLMAQEVLLPLASSRGHPERYRTDDFLALIERADVYVARASQAMELVAGFVALEDEPDALVVRCLCVAPAYEAQQVGHQLLDWAEGLAYERRRPRLLAEVLVDDERARHLYTAHSFSPAPASDRPELLVMEKRLPEES